MVLIGSSLGLLAAFTLHRLCRTVRSRWPKSLAMTGWAVSVVVLLIGILMAGAYLSMRRNPHADMGPIWGILSLALILLLFMCGGFSLVHRRRFGISGAQAFGILMAEAGTAIAVGLLLNKMLYTIADIVRGGNDEIEAILASYESVRVMLSSFDLTLFVSLVLLATFAGNKSSVQPKP